MSWLREVFSRDAREESFDKEILFHLQQVAQKKIEEGASPEEAWRLARLEFGGREQVKQQIREVHTSQWADSLSANVKAAARFIRRSPTFAAAIILTLALGVGANSAVFSAIDAILLRPLPFPHGDELVEMRQFDFKNKNPETHVAPLRLEDWNRLNSTFQAITGWFPQDSSETSGTFPEKVMQAFVAPRFLQVWGVVPALGRDFTAEESHFGGPNVVIISDRYWRTHLNSDTAIVGRAIHLGSAAYTVVGVMPTSFRFPQREVDMWSPNPVDAPYAQSRESTWFNVIGRLKPGVSVAQARADMATVQAQLGKQFPKTDGTLAVEMQPLKQFELNGIENSLWLLYGSVTLLLLIACTNIAALLMARTTERQHEISIRYSLGATRGAIVMQLLTEVFVLALIGSALGLIVAEGASRAFAVLSKDLPRVDEITLQWRILAYSLLCALVATFACGLFPALRGTRHNLSQSLAQGSRTQVSTRMPLQWTLVGFQVSLAVALLIGAGLLLRSFQAMGKVAAGFDADHVLTFHVSGSWGETVDMGKLAQRIDHTLDRLRSIPGVDSAATSATLPGAAGEFQTELKIVGGHTDPNNKIFADTRFVSPGYFTAMRIPVLQGEACRTGLPVGAALVNRSFAETYFPSSPVLGYHLIGAAANTFTTGGQIVGVVGDAREEGLTNPPEPTVYWCYSAPTPDPNYLIRVHGEPMAMADALRRAIHEIEPGRSVYGMMPLQQHIDDNSAETRLRTVLLTVFAITAVALASIGLYGTISYLGRMRQREVGLRIALGALPWRILLSFLWQGMRVTVVGGVAGVLLGFALSRLIAGMLYGVSALDPATYSGVGLLILSVAVLASLVPAIRAARVQPTQVLREE